MRTTPDEVLQGRPPRLQDATVEALPEERDLETLRRQRIRFDGFFAGPTW
jgi:hypothetical protein